MQNNVKKIMSRIIIFTAIVSLLICTYALYVHLLTAPINIIQSETSPDGKYIAYVYESNGGATTGWIYHVSVLPASKKLKGGKGNVYTGSVPPETIEWLDNKRLFAMDFQSENSKRKYFIYGITINWHTVTPK